jgi:hypothetical protein
MNATKYPATVREAGDMAAKLGMKLSEFLEMLGPIPMPPAGYTLAKGSETRWTGPETVKSRWIIQPAWNSTTNTITVELWMADHQPPTYANLTAAEALELAADLTATTHAAESK